MSTVSRVFLSRVRKITTVYRNEQMNTQLLTEYLAKREKLQGCCRLEAIRVEELLRSNPDVCPLKISKGENFFCVLKRHYIDISSELIAADMRLYLFFEEETKIVKDHFESLYRRKKEIQEVFEIRSRDLFLTEEEKSKISARSVLKSVIGRL
jgi:hypothetical protein